MENIVLPIKTTMMCRHHKWSVVYRSALCWLEKKKEKGEAPLKTLPQHI